MASLGLGSGGGVVPALQRAWTKAIETILQGHEDKIDTPEKIVEACRRPLVTIARAAMAAAVALWGLFVLRIISMLLAVALMMVPLGCATTPKPATKLGASLIFPGGGGSGAGGGLTNAELRASPVPVSGTVTSNQGTAAAAASAWPVLVTEDGTNAVVKPGDDANNAVRVNVVAGGAAGGTSSSFGAAVPATGTAAGASDGTNMQLPRVFDGDTGGGTQYVSGSILRKQASGGTVEAGTAADPLRVDPTGTTTQPVSGTVTITPSGTQTAAGAKTNNNAAPGATNVGALVALANAAPPSWTEGNLVLASVDLGGSLRTLIMNATIAVTQSGSWSLAANQSVNAAQINGVTPLMGNGATGTGALRVSIANDSTGIVSQGGTWTVQPGNTANTTAWLMRGNVQTDSAPAGAATALSVMPAQAAAAGGTALGLTAGNYQLLRTDANNGGLTIAGATSHDSAATTGRITAPVLIGAFSSVAAPTDVDADGDAVRLWALRSGALVQQLSFGGVLASTGNGVVGTGVQRVAIASDNTAFSVNVGTFPDNEPINVAQMNGVAVTMGNGAAGTGVQRVTLASDSTGNIATIGTSVTPGTAAANLGKAEDAAHTTGDVGIMQLGVRDDTPTASLAGSDGEYSPIVTDSFGAQWVKIRERRTYGASTIIRIAVTSASTAPFFSICGSATTTVRIQKIKISSTQTTTGYADIIINKTSTAISGGTCAALTQVPFDSASAAGTATNVQRCTAAPTTGTVVGVIDGSYSVAPAATAVGDVDYSAFDYFSRTDAESIVLRGTAQCLQAHFATAVTAPSVHAQVQWTEE